VPGAGPDSGPGPEGYFSAAAVASKSAFGRGQT
jgi:hypothetical protein